MKIDFDVPQRCPGCKSLNFRVYGVILDERLTLEVRCIACGKIVNHVEVKNA